jgi:hypothetical protein
MMDWLQNLVNTADVKWTDAVQALIQCIGFPLVIYQVNELRKSLYSTTHSNIYTHYVDTVRWFLDKPALYPYFREGVCLKDSGSTPELVQTHAQVHTLCELTTTLFEHAILERRNMPSTTWRDCWLPYIEASYEHSIEMRLFFEAHHRFYVPEFCALITSEIAPKMQPSWNHELRQLR